MRLIDADKMKEYMKVFTGKELMENEEVFEIIDEQPTVKINGISLPGFGQWNKLTFTELTEEEEEDSLDRSYIVEGLPPYDEIVLITDGKYVWKDCFHIDDVVYLDSGDGIEDVIAWMPLPEPPKKGEEDD